MHPNPGFNLATHAHNPAQFFPTLLYAVPSVDPVNSNLASLLPQHLNPIRQISNVILCGTSLGMLHGELLTRPILERN
jgi:hypothetical protein